MNFSRWKMAGRKLLLILTGSLIAFRICDGSVLKFESKPDNVNSDAPQCGYESCELGKEGFINVHMVPHTHDDVGWLKTVDQYFYGARDNIQFAGVQYVLDTVLDELQRDPAHRFIYVELAFFSRWWHQQDDRTRHIVKGLVNAGRLEFILGGWSMNDEASTHYVAIIDQHTYGFRFLKNNFGDCARPRIGWQIDPFGHSRETASLFAQFGFDGLFFARLDYQDQSLRTQEKRLEVMWRGSESLGDQASLLTGVLYYGYGEPPGFCFECGDTPIMDDPSLEDYNVDSRVQDFINVVHDQAQHYTTNHIMFTMGSDFQYENAHLNFKNMDKIIKHVNEKQLTGGKINAFYSTPSCYILALNKANNSYTHKEDDFFPYAHTDHAFWTGYFTSRAALKGYVRLTNNFFQVCKQLDAWAFLGPEHGSDVKLRHLKDAMGIVQHHDGVSGTEKQHVAYDYARRLAYGTSQCEEVVNSAFSKLLPVSEGTQVPTFAFCTLFNVSYCPLTETSQQFVVFAYNPFSHGVEHWVRIPVVGSKYTVVGSDIKRVDAQVVGLSPATRSLPDRTGSLSDGELVFLAQIPPLGFSTYFVTKSATLDYGTISRQQSWVSALKADFTIVNEYLSVDFDGATGLIKGLHNLPQKIDMDLRQTLLFYTASSQGQVSGAYIFRPNSSTVYPISAGSPVQTTVVQGPLVQEVRQVFSDWASQVVRLYNGSRHLEIEWTVGPIPVGDQVGREVISRFSSSLLTDGTWYTDANGREVLQRKRNYRPTWNLTQTEPVAGNYYPVNTKIFMQDKTRNVQFTVLTDRSQGGASINDGQLELMLHRRLLHDDGLGVGEPLDEPGIDGRGLIVRGKHFIYLDNIPSSVRHQREAAQRLFFHPKLAFTELKTTPQDYVSKYHTNWSGLKGQLPDNVNLLSLEQWDASSLMIRLEHFYASNEDPQLSQPATVQLQNLFVPFTIDSVQELTLGANQPLETATRLQWTVQDFGQTARDMKSFVVPVDPNKLEVVLKPMQIRTFRVTLK